MGGGHDHDINGYMSTSKVESLSCIAKVLFYDVCAVAVAQRSVYLSRVLCSPLN